MTHQPNTVVHYNGEKYELDAQDAYPETDGTSTWYEAHGRDASGKEYYIRWSADMTIEDEEQRCKWLYPDVVQPIDA